MPAADHLAGRIDGAVRARAVILHGSLAAGGFRPGHSDLDLLAVVDEALSDGQAAALERMVREADTGDAAGVDLHVITAGVAAAPVRTPPVELYVGRHGTEIEVARRVAADPDLPAELSMARADGIALRGAAPREVLGPVPPEWLVDRSRHWLTRWRSLTDDTAHAAFMVVTACRMWRFAVEGVHCGKAEAGEWALARDPSLVAVGQALRGEPIGRAGIAHLLDVVLTDRQW